MSQRACFSWKGARDGYLAMLAVSLSVVPFGISFGVAAVDAGLSLPLAVFMSASVFAGASQFVALDLLAPALPLAPLLLSTFAVNARHILMGATLHPWLSACPTAARWGVLSVLSDANWALASRAYEGGERDIGILAGAGIALWSSWVLGTAIGAWMGADLGDLSRYGLDVLMLGFFGSMLVGMWEGPEDLLPWLMAAAVALGASWLLPSGWHILAGTLAGGLAGAWRHDR